MSDELKTNGFNKQKVQSFMRQWQAAEDKAASLIGEAMQACKETKDEILDAAEAAGIKKSTMRKVAKRRKLLNQAEDIRENIESEEMRDQFDNVMLAAGLPLFEIAEKEARAEPKKPKATKADAADDGAGKPH